MSDHSDLPTSAFPREEGAHYPTPFGRGWIPASRDIGLPGHACASFVAAADAASPHAVEPVGRHNGWSGARKVSFLHYLAEKGDVRAACARVGMSRTSAYLLRRRERVFAQGWAAALVLARQHVEEVLATRALDGVEEAVFYHGEQVATRRRYDARLLLAHLGRLDRLAGESFAGEQAERFDEVLAVLAGEAPPPGCFDAADDGAADAAAPEAILPSDRAQYVHAAAGLAATEAWETWHAAYLDGQAEAEDEPQPGCGGYYAEAAEDWDDWQARAFARVDALVGEGASLCGDDVAAMGAAGMEPPVEFKSITGPAVEDPAGDFHPGRANCVNPDGCEAAFAKKSERVGNGSRGLRLCSMKAGAATLHPPPTAALADPFSRKIRNLDRGRSAGGLAREQSQFDAAGTGADKADLLGGGFAEVDHAVAVEGAAIVDGDYDGISGAGVSHPDLAAEGQRAVRGGESVGIEALPAGGAVAGQFVPVIARHARTERFEPGGFGSDCFGNRGLGKRKLGSGRFGDGCGDGWRGALRYAVRNGEVLGEHGARKRERGQSRDGGNKAHTPVTRSECQDVPTPYR